MGKSYGAYENPKEICHRYVYNDAVCSPWFEWEGISQKISAEDFIQEIKECNMDPGKLSINTFCDEAGIVVDYDLRIQIWIPDTAWKNFERDMEYLRFLLKTFF